LLFDVGNALAQELFAPVEQTPMMLDQSPRISQLRQQPTTKSLELVKIDLGALQGDSAQINLPGQKTLTFSKKSLDTTGATSFVWHGTLKELPGTATLVVHDGNVTGTVQDGQNLYHIEPVGGGVHALVKIDSSKFPPEHPPSFENKERERRGELPVQGTPADQHDGPVGIDVLVAYTASAKSAVSDIAATIQLAVAEANQSYVNSGVNIKLNLVDSFEITYVETGKSFDTILADFVANADVNNHRNNSGADLAALIINQTDFCGLADAIMANAATAFAVVHYGCATGYYSFAHELGHLMGARHDQTHDPSTTPFAYGHGNEHPSSVASQRFRTIMAYACNAPDNCDPRIQYWSTPNVTYGGVPVGTAATNDNARVLNGTATTVAAFKSTAGSDAGSIWRFTGTPCSGNSCPGWQRLDDNGASVRIAAGAGNLYQLHNSGRIWKSTGTPCSGNSCPGWQMLDNNPASIEIAAGDGNLYQLHNSGRIWKSTGTPCSGNSCPGWQMLDNNGATVAIVASENDLYQLHDSGRIWKYTGTPCTGNSCPGWQMLDNNPATLTIVAGTGGLYQLHNTGRIWKYTGTPCSGNSCPGWQMLDANPAGMDIVADGGGLYQLHNTGRIWKYTGTPCSGNSCPGWQMLDNNGMTGRLSAAGGNLYQMHLARKPRTRTRSCYECR
jgi:hypothetical protein